MTIMLELFATLEVRQKGTRENLQQLRNENSKYLKQKENKSQGSKRKKNSSNRSTQKYRKSKKVLINKPS